MKKIKIDLGYIVMKEPKKQEKTGDFFSRKEYLSYTLGRADWDHSHDASYAKGTYKTLTRATMQIRGYKNKDDLKAAKIYPVQAEIFLRPISAKDIETAKQQNILIDDLKHKSYAIHPDIEEAMEKTIKSKLNLKKEFEAVAIQNRPFFYERVIEKDSELYVVRGKPHDYAGFVPDEEMALEQALWEGAHYPDTLDYLLQLNTKSAFLERYENECNIYIASIRIVPTSSRALSQAQIQAKLKEEAIAALSPEGRKAYDSLVGMKPK